jgi:hypothetical protein
MKEGFLASAASVSVPNARISLKRLLWVGPLAIIAAIIVNQILRLLAVSLLNISSEFPPLQVGPPIFFTLIGVLGAAIVFAIIARFSRRPIRLFRTIALVVLLISFVPDILLLTSNAMPGTSPVAVGSLAIMHLVTWAITVWMLTTLARE